MNQKIISLIILITLLLSSCQTSSQSEISISTEVNIPTAELEITNTPPPTNTLIPTPVLIETGIGIELTDLPTGFVQIPSEQIGMTVEEASGKSFSNQNPFIFYNATDDQIITGFTTLLKSENDISNFNSLLEKPELAIKAFSEFYGAIKISKEPEIQGFSTLGDAQTTIHITLDASSYSDNQISYSVNMVAFRHKDLGIYILDMVSMEKNGTSIFPDYANGLANRFENLTELSIVLEKNDPSSLEQTINWADPGVWLLANGYEKIDLKGIGITGEAWKEFNIDSDVQHAYQTHDESSFILVTSKLLKSYEDIGLFDIHNNDNEETTTVLKSFTSLLEATDFERFTVSFNDEEQGRYNIFTLTDADSSSQVIATLKESKYQFDLIAFREENVVFHVLTYNLYDQKTGPLRISNQKLSAHLALMVSATSKFRVEPIYAEMRNIKIPDLSEIFVLPSSPLESDFPELLPDFWHTPTEFLNITSEQLSGQTFANELPFHFAGNYQNVLGFMVPLDTQENINSFNTILNSPDDATKNILAYYNTTFSEFDKINGVYISKAFTTLGDEQVYRSISAAAPNEVKGFKIEMLAFKRNNIGYYILLNYSKFNEGVSIFPAFANQFADHLYQQEIGLNANPNLTYTPPESTIPLIAWIEPGKNYLNLGYERVSLDDIQISNEEWQNLDLTYDTLFIYKHMEGPKIVLGTNKFLKTYQEVGKFDVEIEAVDSTLLDLVQAIGGTSARDLSGKEEGHFGLNYCDKRRIVTADIDGKPYRFTAHKVRDENIGFFIFTIEPPSPVNPNSYPDFANTACHETTGLLLATKQFRIEFPIYKISDLTLQTP